MTCDYKTISEFDNTSNDWQDNYICDIREFYMPKSIYEVFKYFFKDIDVKDLEVFRYLFFKLMRKRLRQGHGELYNLKVDYMDFYIDDKTPDVIENYLEYKDEEPVITANKCIKDMTEKYGDYKKISIQF